MTHLKLCLLTNQVSIIAKNSHQESLKYFHPKSRKHVVWFLVLPHPQCKQPKIVYKYQRLSFTSTHKWETLVYAEFYSCILLATSCHGNSRAFINRNDSCMLIHVCSLIPLLICCYRSLLFNMFCVL